MLLASLFCRVWCSRLFPTSIPAIWCMRVRASICDRLCLFWVASFLFCSFSILFEKLSRFLFCSRQSKKKKCFPTIGTAILSMFSQLQLQNFRHSCRCATTCTFYNIIVRLLLDVATPVDLRIHSIIDFYFELFRWLFDRVARTSEKAYGYNFYPDENKNDT